MSDDPAEIAKIVHDYIERGIGCDYDRLNSPPPPIYIKPVKLMTIRDRIIEEAAKKLQNKVDKLILQKEEKEMKATSVQKIENVNNICFSIENHPAEMESKLVIVASTNDDIFAFEFEGPELLQCCKRAGLFTGWEKDQEIRDKKEYQSLMDRYSSTIHGEIENFTDEKPSTRADILHAAEKCVCGQREQDYGSPESNFQLIADLWNGYLGNTLSKEKRDFEKELGVTHKHKELSVPWEISAMDVSMMMALLKIARIKNGGGSGDSFVDLAGYAACGGEIWAGQKHQKDQN